MAVIQSLRQIGCDPIFFDIDALRPSFDQVIERFRKEAPDLIGISAVVSTAYAYVKRLCLRLKEVLPGVTLVVGGNLAASAELLHRFCRVDLCVIGEGERIIQNLVHGLERTGGRLSEEELSRIRGITFLGRDGQMRFTGYEESIPAAELADPDYSILERYSRIDHFFQDPFTRGDFAQDPRSKQSHRAGRRMGTVISTKGCVARCTFCHRWDRGFRQISPRKVLGRIRHLMERRNVGFVMFGDENFGSDLKALDELIDGIRPLDLLWQVGGVRARTLDTERLRRMREAGCVALYYGFETGSADILKIMEKNLPLEKNFQVARATYEAGLYTIYQLVLGMPGENDRTISETIEMARQITEFLPQPPDQRLSINYIQALPGTPVYEYARARGLIGPRLEDEDEYLTRISDVNASDDTRFLNFTDSPHLTVKSWRPRILYEASAHWYRKQRSPVPEQSGEAFPLYQRGGYFNLHSVRRCVLLSKAFYPMRGLLVALWTLASSFRRTPPRIFAAHLWEWILWTLRGKRPESGDYRSLRETMRGLAETTSTPPAEAMRPLRLGR
jgi:radical SAM superfamily enzyme YgiQ (UPF0313 family)